MNPDKLECIDDTNKPADFPSNLWIKKGKVYTIDRVDRMHMSGGTLGVQLKEIDTTNNFPYTHFDLKRFRPVVDSPDLAEDEVEELELVN